MEYNYYLYLSGGNTDAECTLISPDCLSMEVCTTDQNDDGTSDIHGIINISSQQNYGKTWEAEGDCADGTSGCCQFTNNALTWHYGWTTTYCGGCLPDGGTICETTSDCTGGDECVDNYGNSFGVCINHRDIVIPNVIYVPIVGCTDESACNYGLQEDCSYPQTGDLNLDCEMNVVDAVNMVEIVLQQTPQTEQQIMMGDINQDGTVNVVDIVMLIAIILGALFN